MDKYIKERLEDIIAAAQTRADDLDRENSQKPEPSQFDYGMVAGIKSVVYELEKLMELVK